MVWFGMYMKKTDKEVEMTSVRIITDKELENWSNMSGSIDSGAIARIAEEIIKLRKFTKRLIEEREEMYGKLSGAILEILFDSMRNEVDIKTR